MFLRDISHFLLLMNSCRTDAMTFGRQFSGPWLENKGDWANRTVPAYFTGHGRAIRFVRENDNGARRRRCKHIQKCLLVRRSFPESPGCRPDASAYSLKYRRP